MHVFCSIGQIISQTFSILPRLFVRIYSHSFSFSFFAITSYVIIRCQLLLHLINLFTLLFLTSHCCAGMILSHVPTRFLRSGHGFPLSCARFGLDLPDGAKLGLLVIKKLYKPKKLNLKSSYSL